MTIEEFTVDVPPLRAFLPALGQRVEVLEICPWDTVPDHTVGEVVEAGKCWRADDYCVERPEDGDWIVLVTERFGGVFEVDGAEAYCRHTLCRVRAAADVAVTGSVPPPAAELEITA